MKRDLCDEEILDTVRWMHARIPVPVQVDAVAERIGADARGVGRRMARLARSGALAVCDGRLYTVAP